MDVPSSEAPTCAGTTQGLLLRFGCFGFRGCFFGDCGEGGDYFFGDSGYRGRGGFVDRSRCSLGIISSYSVDEFDVEDQCCVCGYSRWRPSLPVTEIRWDSNTSTLANVHVQQRLSPAGNDQRQEEPSGARRVVGGAEHATVFQPTGVLDLVLPIWSGARAIAIFQDGVAHTVCARPIVGVGNFIETRSFRRVDLVQAGAGGLGGVDKRDDQVVFAGICAAAAAGGCGSKCREDCLMR